MIHGPFAWKKKDFFSFEMLARICKVMTFSRCLKYKWKGNRWSVAIVAAEKSSAFELSVIHYIHVINANAGWAFLSLYNVCSVTTCVTRLLALVTRLRMAHLVRFIRVHLFSLPFFSTTFWLCLTSTFLSRKPEMIAMGDRIYIT